MTRIRRSTPRCAAGVGVPVEGIDEGNETAAVRRLGMVANRVRGNCGRRCIDRRRVVDREGAAAAGAEGGDSRPEDDGAADARFQQADVQHRASPALHRVDSEGGQVARVGARGQHSHRVQPGGGGAPADILPEVTPAKDEPVVSSGLDKFVGTDPKISSSRKASRRSSSSASQRTVPSSTRRPQRRRAAFR